MRKRNAPLCRPEKKVYLIPSKKSSVNRSEHIREVIASGYVVHIGEDAFRQLERDLCDADYSRKYILVDENSMQHCLPVLLASTPSLQQAEIIEIESGEKHKTIEICTRLWEVLTELKADRHSLLVNLGGGVIGDMGGFVASTFKRGIDFINVPTTLLAQVDASVGGKVGVDLRQLKNQVGLFNNPQAVYIHPVFLNTLPKKQVMSGFAEMIKHGLIADAEHFSALREFDLSRIDLLESHIEQSVRIKNKVVLDDPREKNIRKWLNFGHTIGHALESLSFENGHAELLHGEAIAIGMVCEAWLSTELTGLPAEERDSIADFILPLYPAFQLESIELHRLIEIMRNDKKNRNDKLLFTLLNNVGEAVHDQEVSADLVISALTDYQERLKAVVHET